MISQPYQGFVLPGEMKVGIDLNGYAAGLYTVRLDIEGQSVYRKLIIE
jgi:hypothetical protein